MCHDFVLLASVYPSEFLDGMGHKESHWEALLEQEIKEYDIYHNKLYVIIISYLATTTFTILYILTDIIIVTPL